MKYQVPADIMAALSVAVPRPGGVNDADYLVSQSAWIDSTLRNALRRELQVLDEAETMDVLDRLAALPKAVRDDVEAKIGRALPTGKKSRGDTSVSVSE